jgi:SAM-dependent methyltransferase
MVFDEYAKYYDLLYRDKDYLGEANYIDGLLKKYVPSACKVIELGCGTGKHAELLSHKGYSIYGVDSSAEMLLEAKKRGAGNKNLNFELANISDFHIDEKFDAAISFFHVFSYLSKDEDFYNTLTNVRNVLNDDGCLLFDCWYGPAVLYERPEVRVKRLENDNVKVTRIAEPVLCENINTCEVHYDIFVEDKAMKKIKEISEVHYMRYYFLNEISRNAAKCGYRFEEAFEFMTGKELSKSTWGSCFVLRKKA